MFCSTTDLKPFEEVALAATPAERRRLLLKDEEATLLQMQTELAQAFERQDTVEQDRIVADIDRHILSLGGKKWLDQNVKLATRHHLLMFPHVKSAKERAELLAEFKSLLKPTLSYARDLPLGTTEPSLPACEGDLLRFDMMSDDDDKTSAKLPVSGVDNAALADITSVLHTVVVAQPLKVPLSLLSGKGLAQYVASCGGVNNLSDEEIIHLSSRPQLENPAFPHWFEIVSRSMTIPILSTPQFQGVGNGAGNFSKVLPQFGASHHTNFTLDQMDKLAQMRPDLPQTSVPFLMRRLQLKAGACNLVEWMNEYAPWMAGASSKLSERQAVIDELWSLAADEHVSKLAWFAWELQFNALWFAYRLHIAAGKTSTVELLPYADKFRALVSACKAPISVQLHAEKRSKEGKDAAFWQWDAMRNQQHHRELMSAHTAANELELFQAYVTCLSVCDKTWSPDASEEANAAAMDSTWFPVGFQASFLRTTMRDYVKRMLGRGVANTTDCRMQWVAPGEGIGWSASSLYAAPLLQHRVSFATTEAVRLDLLVAGATEVQVQIYQLHPAKYYKSTGKEFDASTLELDSLVPQHRFHVSTKIERHELARTARVTLDLDQYTKSPGVYVVEALGGGSKTRCLFRKGGSILAVGEPCEHGKLYCLVDEETGDALGGSIFFQGRLFQCRPTLDGSKLPPMILIPWADSSSPRYGTAVLIGPDGVRASIGTLSLERDSYSLGASFFVDREALLSKSQATVAVHTALTLRGALLDPMQCVTRSRLTVTCVDVQGVESQEVVESFQLRLGSAAMHTFSIPEHLKQVSFELSVDVKRQSNGAVETLLAHSIPNTISHAESDSLVDLYLAPAQSSGDLDLLVLGRSGEPYGEQRVELTFEHKWLQSTLPPIVCTTDACGRASLGALEHITSLKATLLRPDNGTDAYVTSRSWDLSCGRTGTVVTAKAATLARQNHRTALPSGDNLVVAVDACAPVVRTAHLYHVVCYGERLYRSDLADEHIRWLDSTRVEVFNTHQLVPGTYALYLCDRTMPLHFQILGASEKRILGETYVLDTRTNSIQSARASLHRPLALSVQVAQTARDLAEGEEEKKEVHHDVVIHTSSPKVRVHVLATHFYVEPKEAEMMALCLAVPQRPNESHINQPLRTQFLKNVQMGDEAAYDLQVEREGARVGNTLPRPSLLVHDRVVGATSFDAAPQLQSEQAYAAAAAASFGGSRGKCESQGAMMDFGAFGLPSVTNTRLPTLEFLRQPSILLTNLVPNAHGVVRVTCEQLGVSDAHHRFLTVVAVDVERGVETAMLSVGAECGIPHTPAFRSTSLAATLATEKHFAQSERVIVVEPSNPGFEIDHVATRDLCVIEHLGDAAKLLLSLLRKTHVGQARQWSEEKLSQLLEWSKLSFERKCKVYGDLSCHEVDLFVALKDVDFFTRVVRPALAEKLTAGLATRANLIDAFLLEQTDVLLEYANDPYKFQQLNALERILLARGLIGCAASPDLARGILQSLVHQAESKPRSTADETRIFQTALQIKSHSDDRGGRASVAQGRRQSEHTKPAAAAAAVPPSTKGFRGVSRGATLGRGGDSSDDSSDDNEAAEEEDDNYEDMQDDFAFESAPGSSFQQASREIGNEKEKSSNRSPPLFHAPPTTKELVERTYWGVALNADSHSLVPVNRFWADYARHILATMESKHFVSPALGEAHSCLSEMLCALAVLDLPQEHDYQPFVYHGSREPLGRIETVAAPVVVFQRLLQEQPMVAEAVDASIRMSMHYVDGASIRNAGKTGDVIALPQYHVHSLTGTTFQRPSHRCDICRATGLGFAFACSGCDWDACQACVNRLLPSSAEQGDGTIQPDAFVTGRVYCSRIILTNVGSRGQNFQLLHQIPSGAVPITAQQQHQQQQQHLPILAQDVALAVYETKVLCKAFYFPKAGVYEQYPPHANKDAQLLSFDTTASKFVRVRDQSAVARERIEKMRAMQAAALAGTGDAANGLDWSLVSQLDSDKTLLEFLGDARVNLYTVDLRKMLWRFSGPANSNDASKQKLFFASLAALRQRAVFDSAVWSMVLNFNFNAGDAENKSYLLALREYMLSQAVVRQRIGAYLSPAAALAGADDIESLEMQHREYTPLINARAHQLQTARNPGALVIQNKAFAAQYRKFLHYLLLRTASFSDTTIEMRMQLVYYLLLQDRVAEAKRVFESFAEAAIDTRRNNSRKRALVVVDDSGDAGGGVNSPMCDTAYDYLRCYFAFSDGKPQEAKPIADAYASYPLAKQRRLFDEVRSQLREMDSVTDTEATDADMTNDALARDQVQRTAAASEASIDLELRGTTLVIRTSGGAAARQVRVSVFPFQVRSAFSNAPFVLAGSLDTGMNAIAPASSVLCSLPKSVHEVQVAPVGTSQQGESIVGLADLVGAETAASNLWIQVETQDGSASCVRAHLANRLRVHIKANQGMLQVYHADTGKPLSQVYVKVYGERKDTGAVVRLKDVYTNQGGVADYASLSTDELKQVKRLAVLIMHSELGSTIKQVLPPVSA